MAVTIAIPTVAHADVVNGSFESGDLQGWTVAKESVSSTFATATIVGDQTVSMGESLFDYIDHVNVSNYSMGLPLAVQPTDGHWQALLLQNGPATTRLSQVVTLGSAPQLTLDLAYHNWYGSFSADQTFHIQIRDAASDQLLGTVFETTGAMTMTMTGQSIDLGAFANMAVRIQLELVASYTFFDVQLDNIHVTGDAPISTDCVMCGMDQQVTSAGSNAEPAVLDDGGCSTTRGGGSLLFAALALVGLGRRRRA